MPQVAFGTVPGIYRSWASTKIKVLGVSGAKHKAFDTLGEAEEFLRSFGVRPPQRAHTSCSSGPGMTHPQLSTTHPSQQTDKPSKQLIPTQSADPRPACVPLYVSRTATMTASDTPTPQLTCSTSSQAQFVGRKSSKPCEPVFCYPASPLLASSRYQMVSQLDES